MHTKLPRAYPCTGTPIGSHDSGQRTIRCEHPKPDNNLRTVASVFEWRIRWLLFWVQYPDRALETMGGLTGAHLVDMRSLEGRRIV